MESTGSAAREFNAYQQYRQQLQSQAEAHSSGNTERDISAPKHHNPIIEATNNSRELLPPTELRQRVCFSTIYFLYFELVMEICFPEVEGFCHNSNSTSGHPIEIL